MNFGDDTFVTPPLAARGIIERATQAGIGLEVEAFDVGHVVSAVRWIEQGLIPEPMRINLVFGVPGGIDASPEALAAMLRPLPPETFWTVTCVGRHHPRMLGLALLLRCARESGRDSRTRSTSAAACWRRPTPPWSAPPIELAHAVGREVATQEETPSLLGLASSG